MGRDVEVWNQMSVTMDLEKSWIGLSVGLKESSVWGVVSSEALLHVAKRLANCKSTALSVNWD